MPVSALAFGRALGLFLYGPIRFSVADLHHRAVTMRADKVAGRLPPRSHNSRSERCAHSGIGA
jgi:hypothetical protein